MRYHTVSEVWGEITYPFPNVNGATVEVLERIRNFIQYFLIDVLIHAVIKMNPC